MVTIAFVLFGWVAATRLPVELLPDLSYPSITVSTVYADAAPAEVEEMVTRPIEELVGAVPGVVSVESASREGRSEIVLDFEWGSRIDEVMAEVREKLDRARLPIAAERPVVLRYDPAQEPIMRIVLVPQSSKNADTGSDPQIDLAQLRFSAERNIKQPLEKLPGVAAVTVHGGDEEEIVVEVDPERAAALWVDIAQVVLALRADNINRPGGAVTEGNDRYLIRTVHEARTPEQLETIIVRSLGGAELRLRDIASIKRVPIERTEVALFHGRDAVELSVFREGDANTVSVANSVLERVRGLELGPGQRIEVLSNQAAFIEAAIEEVVVNTLLGGVLAVLVLLFFLRDLRSTVVIAVAIPISLLAAFVPLRMLDVSLNLMSLGGLALGVGMLVDNSIVVLESIARVREADGDPLSKASLRRSAIIGTGEIAGAVVASTLTTVAVFLPMAFVAGVAGQLVRDLALAVSFSIVSSLAVSLTLVPVLQSLAGVSVGGNEDSESPPPRTVLTWSVVPFAWAWRLVGYVVSGASVVLRVLSAPLSLMYDALERTYPILLRAALGMRSVVLLAALGICVAGLMGSQRLGRTLLPQVQQGEFYAQLTLPQGTSLERTIGITRVLARSLEDDKNVDLVFSRVGSITQGGSAAGNLVGTHLAQINVRLRRDPDLDLVATESRLFATLQNALRIPTASLRLGRPALFSFDAPLEVQVFSDDMDLARRHAMQLLPALAEVESLRDATPDDLAGRPEVRIRFDRERLGRVGLDVERAAAAVQRAIQGEVATQLHAADQQLDVRVQVPRVDRSDAEDLERILVGLTDGVPVRLGAVASVEAGMGPAEIRRINGNRGLRVQARLATTDLGAVADAVQRVIDAHADPQAQVTARISGQADAMQESLISLAFTALLSLFLVYVVMASSFESLHHPLLIMFTVPLAAVGVVAACLCVGIPISAMVGIGAIILGGIVVNNAIVLINSVNHRRGAGMGVKEALVAAGKVRLRPILMTTATTVLGLMPMALGIGEGAALRQPLAVAVIGGLTVATILTLFVIPCAYAVLPGRRRDAWGGAPPGG